MNVGIEELRFERDGRTVLAVPSLSLRADRSTAIVGPNGAGKTTLLRLIAGLERPTAGRITVEDRRLGPIRRSREDLAFVFQEDVFLRQSVRANLELGLTLRGVGPRERAERIDEAARLLGIVGILHRRADLLSGGEGRRASLARALCLRASLVLLDEPIAGLDPPTYARLLDELPGVLQAFSATTVLVTHDHQEALRLGDDLVVLVDGRVRAAGEKQTVFLDPRTPDVSVILGYVVVEANGRQLAVRPASLAPGPGPLEFSLAVDDVLNLIDHREIVGTIGRRRVHVRLPPGAAAPQRGARIQVHVDRACEVT